jgi:hypothetical protein
MIVVPEPGPEALAGTAGECRAIPMTMAAMSEGSRARATTMAGRTVFTGVWT